MNVIAYQPENPMPLFWLLSMVTPYTEVRICVGKTFVPYVIRKATDVIRVTKVYSRVLGHAPIVTEIGVTVDKYGRGFLAVCVD